MIWRENECVGEFVKLYISFVVLLVNVRTQICLQTYSYTSIQRKAGEKIMAVFDYKTDTML